MAIEFDPAKDIVNREKHGVSLAFGETVLGDSQVEILPTVRQADGEERFKAVGSVDGRLWTAVLTFRGDAVRFISVRRSNTSERREYQRRFD